MPEKEDRARDLAEEALDKAGRGDTDKGRELVDEARKIDSGAVEEVANEVERDREKAERFKRK